MQTKLTEASPRAQRMEAKRQLPPSLFMPRATLDPCSDTAPDRTRPPPLP